jgi:hypothetical protein
LLRPLTDGTVIGAGTAESRTTLSGRATVSTASTFTGSIATGLLGVAADSASPMAHAVSKAREATGEAKREMIIVVLLLYE